MPSPVVKQTTQHAVTLDSGALTADHIKLDAQGNLVISNSDLAHLIQTNVSNAVKNKAGQAAISVGVTVGT